MERLRDGPMESWRAFNDIWHAAVVRCDVPAAPQGARPAGGPALSGSARHEISLRTGNATRSASPDHLSFSETLFLVWSDNGFPSFPTLPAFKYTKTLAAAKARTARNSRPV